MKMLTMQCIEIFKSLCILSDCQHAIRPTQPYHPYSMANSLNVTGAYYNVLGVVT